jgi:beta-1,4-mannooligosaccharide phosphorylase
VPVYNGADDNLVYRTGVVVFDQKDPRKVLYRSDEPVFQPEKEWEKIGQVPNVVFVEGMAKRGRNGYFIMAARTSLTEWQPPRPSHSRKFEISGPGQAELEAAIGWT